MVYFKSKEVEDMLVKCCYDEEILFDEPSFKPCGREFGLDRNNLFAYGTVDYDSSTLYQYYTVCPHCGYLVMIPEEELSFDDTERLREEVENDPYLYRKNCLKSELFYLENLTRRRVLERKR